MRSLKLDVRTATGLESVTRGNPQALFGQGGRYQFVVSENLETEDETGANQACTVEFREAARR